jgi:hypothetical protein
MPEHVTILTYSIQLVYEVFYLLGCCAVSMSGLILMFCNDVFVLPSRVKRFEDGINMLSQNVSNKLLVNTAHTSQQTKYPKLHHGKGLKSCITFWCQLQAADGNNIHTLYSVHCYRWHQQGILKHQQQTTHWHCATSQKIKNPKLHHDKGLIFFMPLKCKF